MKEKKKNQATTFTY